MTRGRRVQLSARLCALCLVSCLNVQCAGSEGTLLVRAHGGSPNSAANGGASSGGVGGSAGQAGAAPWYSPGVDSSWQAQLQGSVDTNLAVDLFYLDADDAGPATLRQIRAQGDHLLCYLSAGTFEPWRPDAAEFPASVIGGPLTDHPDERWLDFRDASVLALMRARIARLASVGCEGIDPSSIDTSVDPGFAITEADALGYARWFAEEIHAQGMSAGLSSRETWVDSLNDAFDWALAVDCLASTGCVGFEPVREREHAVLLVEFGDQSRVAEVCPAAATLGFDALLKTPTFDAFRIGCKDGP